jgi:hypothetical protein
MIRQDAERILQLNHQIKALEDEMARCRMRGLEFLEQTAVRETDGNRVAPRADINTYTQL